MKTKMQLIIGLIIIVLGSCQKGNSNDYQSIGKITGPDIRMCACCGGWYIQIDGVTYEFDSLPNNTNIDLQKGVFPIMVKLDWQLSNGIACPDKRIIIQRIAKE